MNDASPREPSFNLTFRTRIACKESDYALYLTRDRDSATIRLDDGTRTVGRVQINRKRARRLALALLAYSEGPR